MNISDLADLRELINVGKEVSNSSLVEAGSTVGSSVVKTGSTVVDAGSSAIGSSTDDVVGSSEGIFETLGLGELFDLIEGIVKIIGSAASIL